jgi:AcrR family transcriptional regulator
MARPGYSSAAAQQVRHSLIHGALELYLQHGLEAVTLRQLAQRVGLSHTVGYRYFRNKQALLAQMRCLCLSELQERLLPRTTPASNPLQRLRSSLRNVLRYGYEQPAKYRLVFTEAQPDLAKYPQLMAMREQVFSACVDLVQDAIDSQQLRGDARLLSHGLWSLLHGMLSLHSADQLRHGLTLLEMAEPLLEHFLRASCSAQAAMPMGHTP